MKKQSAARLARVFHCSTVFTPVPMVLHSPDGAPLGYGGNVGGGYLIQPDQ
jgi:hypothetical protein